MSKLCNRAWSNINLRPFPICLIFRYQTDACVVFSQKQKPKAASGQFERAARIPKNELLDMLFKLFKVQTHWAMKVLRERTKQPLDYLKETLEDIAVLHKVGTFFSTHYLKA